MEKNSCNYYSLVSDLTKTLSCRTISLYKNGMLRYKKKLII